MLGFGVPLPIYGDSFIPIAMEPFKYPDLYCPRPPLSLSLVSHALAGLAIALVCHLVRKFQRCSRSAKSLKSTYPA